MVYESGAVFSITAMYWVTVPCRYSDGRMPSGGSKGWPGVGGTASPVRTLAPLPPPNETGAR